MSRERWNVLAAVLGGVVLASAACGGAEDEIVEDGVDSLDAKADIASTVKATTDKNKYGAQDAIQVTVANGYKLTSIYLPGCNATGPQQQLGSGWKDLGADKACFWEGFAVKVAPGSSLKDTLQPKPAGSYRVKVVFKTGCTSKQTFSQCPGKIKTVHSSAFSVGQAKTKCQTMGGYCLPLTNPAVQPVCASNEIADTTLGCGSGILGQTSTCCLPKPPPPCDPAEAPYISWKPEECMVIKYKCAPDQIPFSNACGCGCKPSGLNWYESCGTPVCMPNQPAPTDVPKCSAPEVLGAGCQAEGQRCLPPVDLGCGKTLICATTQPVQCPKSQRAFKDQITYLDRGGLDRFYKELLGIKLATYKYTFGPAHTPARLGLIIEDTTSDVCLDPQRKQIDVYGYASMAVAGLQVQAQQIAALKSEVERLKKQLGNAARAR